MLVKSHKNLTFLDNLLAYNLINDKQYKIGRKLQSSYNKAYRSMGIPKNIKSISGRLDPSCLKGPDLYENPKAEHQWKLISAWISHYCGHQGVKMLYLLTSTDANQFLQEGLFLKKIVPTVLDILNEVECLLKRFKKRI